MTDDGPPVFANDRAPRLADDNAVALPRFAALAANVINPVLPPIPRLLAAILTPVLRIFALLLATLLRILALVLTALLRILAPVLTLIPRVLATLLPLILTAILNVLAALLALLLLFLADGLAALLALFLGTFATVLTLILLAFLDVLAAFLTLFLGVLTALLALILLLCGRTLSLLILCLSRGGTGRLLLPLSRLLPPLRGRICLSLLCRLRPSLLWFLPLVLGLGLGDPQGGIVQSVGIRRQHKRQGCHQSDTNEPAFHYHLAKLLKPRVPGGAHFRHDAEMAPVAACAQRNSRPTRHNASAAGVFRMKPG
jgi:hypothetical protein